MSNININLSDVSPESMKTTASFVTINGELLLFITQDSAIEGEPNDVVLLSMEGLLKFQQGLLDALNSGRLQVGPGGVAEIN